MPHERQRSKALSPGAPYTRASFERDLEVVLDRVRPTRVLVPAPQDAHPDHRGAAAVLGPLLERRGEASGAWGWIIHGGLEWPLPKGLHPGLPLAPPPRGRGLAWSRWGLSAGQVERKAAAIGRHHSQVAALSRFVAAFARKNELFSPGLGNQRGSPGEQTETNG